MERAEISRDPIATAYNRIRPYVRKTPVIDCTGADFGLPPARSSSSSSICSTPVRSRHAARSPICCCARCRQPAWSPPRAAITAPRSRTRRRSSAARDDLRAGDYVAGEDRAHQRSARDSWSTVRAMPMRRPHARRHEKPARWRARLRPGRDAARPGHGRHGTGAGAGYRHAAGRGRRRRLDRWHRGVVAGRIRIVAVEPDVAALFAALAAGAPVDVEQAASPPTAWRPPRRRV